MTETDGGEGRGSAPGDRAPGESSGRVEALEAERAALNDRLLRLAAECDNWKKRAAREQSDAVRRGREEVLLDLLDVADGLERALAALRGDASAGAVRDGVSLVLRSLADKLHAQGVRPVGAVGERFDPRLHDAVARAPSRDVEPGTVLNELKKGYLLGDRVLRPASVVVAETAEPPARAPRS
jgi:molecular chaperone GrpE